ncbi:hypothetical protein DFH29DRAFT_948823 [Suillus ampliporus]|nr:hypothetical protein DFH29DRAFT_974395 [Suillus ampliporus]KAG0696965.1 hypothetical protein DFH29DRAFT_948823 [Suillus ampliporus]
MHLLHRLFLAFSLNHISFTGFRLSSNPWFYSVTREIRRANGKGEILKARFPLFQGPHCSSGSKICSEANTLIDSATNY